MRLVTKLYIVLAVLSCMVYANTFKHGYVLDDVMMITENQYVKQGIAGIPVLLKTLHLNGFESNAESDYYRPLGLVLFAIEYELFGLNPLQSHVFNVLFYAICVMMLFWVLNKLFNERKIVVVFVASLLFAVHPVHTEVVANIKSRDELLCFFFAFLSLVFFIDYARRGKLYQLLTGAFCFFLSVLSKETVVTFLGIIPLIFFFYENDNKKRSINITVSAFLSIIIFVFIWFSVLNNSQPGKSIELNTIFNISTSMPGASIKPAPHILILGYYVMLLFVPYPLNSNYSFSSFSSASFSDIDVLISLAVYLFLISISIIRLFKYKNDLWAFSILFYLITLSLFSNIVFLLGQPMANRFAFFPSVGFCLVTALAFEKWILRSSSNSFAILKSTKSLAVLLPVLLCYSIMTVARNKDWKDNFTLINADLAKSSGDAFMQYKAGLELQKIVDDEPDSIKQRQIQLESIKHFAKSLEINPEYTEAHADMGVAYFRIDSLEAAEMHFKRVLDLNPVHLNASVNLGTLFYKMQRYREAVHYYQKTIRIDSTVVIAWYNMGICFARVQLLDSSLFCINKVIEIAPEYDNYKSFGNAALLYKITGKMDSARIYEQIMRQYYPQFTL